MNFKQYNEGIDELRQAINSIVASGTTSPEEIARKVKKALSHKSEAEIKRAIEHEMMGRGKGGGYESTI